MDAPGQDGANRAVIRASGIASTDRDVRGQRERDPGKKGWRRQTVREGAKIQPEGEGLYSAGGIGRQEGRR